MEHEARIDFRRRSRERENNRRDTSAFNIGKRVSWVQVGYRSTDLQDSSQHDAQDVRQDLPAALDQARRERGNDAPERFVDPVDAPR